jgi:hypothetical protein
MIIYKVYTLGFKYDDEEYLIGYFVNKDKAVLSLNAKIKEYLNDKNYKYKSECEDGDIYNICILRELTDEEKSHYLHGFKKDFKRVESIILSEINVIE